MARSGGSALSAADGLALMDLALSRDEALLVPVRLDVAGLAARYPAGDVPALLRRLVTPGRPAAGAGVSGAGISGAGISGAGISGAGTAGADGAPLRQHLARLPGAERDRALLDLVRAHVAAVLGTPRPRPSSPAGRSARSGSTP